MDILRPKNRTAVVLYPGSRTYLFDCSSLEFMAACRGLEWKIGRAYGDIVCSVFQIGFCLLCGFVALRYSRGVFGK